MSFQCYDEEPAPETRLLHPDRNMKHIITLAFTAGGLLLSISWKPQQLLQQQEEEEEDVNVDPDLDHFNGADAEDAASLSHVKLCDDQENENQQRKSWTHFYCFVLFISFLRPVSLG